MNTSVIQAGSLVISDGEPGIWRVRALTIEPGGHYRVAWLERPDSVEAWNRRGHSVPVGRLHLAPPDPLDLPA